MSPNNKAAAAVRPLLSAAPVTLNHSPSLHGRQDGEPINKMIGRSRRELEVAKDDEGRAEFGGCHALSVRQRLQDLVGVGLADAPVALTSHSCAGNGESLLVARDAVHTLVVAASVRGEARPGEGPAQALHGRREWKVIHVNTRLCKEPRQGLDPGRRRMADSDWRRHPFQRLEPPSADTMVRDDRDSHAKADAFFARGPVSCCPAALCVRTLCRSVCAAPGGLCRTALTFRPDLRCLSPWAPPEVRFDAIIATIRSLSLTAPRNLVALQAITDLGTAQPCLCWLMAQTLGEGVASAPASSEVLSSNSTDGLFSERGMWLFPQNGARFPPSFPNNRFPETFPGRLCVGSDNRCLFPCFSIDGSGVCSRTCEVCCGCCAGAGPAPPLPSSGARVILFIHGGAFVLTNAETYPTMIGFELVRRTGASVLFPNFARPPHARFPSQLLSLSALLQKLVLFYGAGRVAVAGDSAGANLAIGTVLCAMADGCPPPSCLLLFSPWADLSPEADADPSRAIYRPAEDTNRTADTSNAVDGTTHISRAMNGTAMNGMAVNGTAANGTAVNGTAVNGTAVNGTADYLTDDLITLFSRAYVEPNPTVEGGQLGAINGPGGGRVYVGPEAGATGAVGGSRGTPEPGQGAFALRSLNDGPSSADVRDRATALTRETLISPGYGGATGGGAKGSGDSLAVARDQFVSGAYGSDVGGGAKGSVDSLAPAVARNKLVSPAYGGDAGGWLGRYNRAADGPAGSRGCNSAGGKATTKVEGSGGVGGGEARLGGDSAAGGIIGGRIGLGRYSGAAGGGTAGSRGYNSAGGGFTAALGGDSVPRAITGGKAGLEGLPRTKIIYGGAEVLRDQVSH